MTPGNVIGVWVTQNRYPHPALLQNSECGVNNPAPCSLFLAPYSLFLVLW